MHVYLVQSASSENGFVFSMNENIETLESTAINDGQSMLAMFPTSLYVIEGLETATLQ